MKPVHRIAIIFAVGCALRALGGCAANSDGWESHPTHEALPAVFREVDAAEIQRRCPPPRGAITHGCAQRSYGDRICYIYVEHGDAPAWLATHELAHCAGFDHWPEAR